MSGFGQSVDRDGALREELEAALCRANPRLSFGRWAVYIPRAVILGTYDDPDEARTVAEKWSEDIEEVVVVDRSPTAPR